MSYILDALKKSEQIRNQNNPRMVFAVQNTAPAIDDKGTRRLWQHLILFVIILAMCILFYWFYNHNLLVAQPVAREINTHSFSLEPDEILPIVKETNPPSVTQITEPSIEPNIIKDVAKEERPTTVIPKATKDSLPNNITDTKVVEYSQPTEKQPIKSQANSDDLPLPKIVIAMHMYSETPANRLVQINDKALKEGDEIENGLKLVQITPTGVTLNYRGVIIDKKVVVNP